MLVSQVSNLLHESQLSPEQLAKRVGLSNMTFRRWLKRPAKQKLPAVYDKILEKAVFQLIVDGKLKASSQTAKWALKSADSLSFEATIRSLGMNKDLNLAPGNSDEKIVLGLSQIGSGASRQLLVDKNKKKLLFFQKMGAEWKRRISTLREAISSESIQPIDKLVAYGALFYLIWPIDLIPDNIPVFGLLDDYAILGLASTYCLSRMMPFKGMLKGGESI